MTLRHLYSRIFALVVFCALGAVSVWIGADRLNPDGLSYLRLSDYWHNGRIDLAISGYWPPVFAWVMVALTPFIDDPGLKARLATAVGGLVFLIGSDRLYWASGLRNGWLGLALISTAVFAAAQILVQVTPDLLFSGLLAWGLAAFASLKDPPLKRSLKGGFLFGLSYLTKTPGLPLGLAMIFTVPIFLIMNKAVGKSTGAKMVGAGLVGLMIVSSPWITILSGHYERFTWSTAAQANVWGSNQNWSIFNEPREGRLFSWEDPSELVVVDLTDSEHRENDKTLVERWRWKLEQNLASTGLNLRSFDLLGLLPGLALIALFICSTLIDRFRGYSWRILGFGLLFVAGLYTLSWSSRIRYFYVCYPIMVALATGLLATFATSATNRRKSTSALPQKPLTVIVTSIFALSLFYESLFNFRSEYWKDSRQLPFKVGAHIAEVLEEIGASGPSLEVGYTQRIPLYVAFHSGQPFLGAQRMVRNVEELFRVQAKIAIVENGNPFIDVANKHSLIENIDHLFLPEYSDIGTKFLIYKISAM